MWCLFIGYEEMCGAFSSVMRRCVVPFHRLRGDVWCLFIGYEEMCGAFSSVMRRCVVPFHRL